MNNTDVLDTKPNVSTKQSKNGAQAEPTPPPSSKGLLKVAIDTHADFDVWMPMFDGTPPKPASKGSRPQLLKFLERQRSLGWDIITCYEAGPFGFVLHRELVARGIRNLVIRPRNWDDAQRRVRTDRTDTRGMLVALDRYTHGQGRALCVVHVPTEEQEQRRQLGRSRRELLREARRQAQKGRGYALFHGYRLTGAWYSPRRWPAWRAQLPPYLVELLQPWQKIIMFMVEEAKALSAQMKAQPALVDQPLPVGVGRECAEELEREIGDWTRFKNRRTTGSFVGLTPGEASSGPSRRQGGITKCGNGRLRWLLIQIAWRLVKFQPTYIRTQRWIQRCQSATHTRRRRQYIVAFAREFLIDWWRLRTGQTTAEKLGLKMMPPGPIPTL